VSKLSGTVSVAALQQCWPGVEVDEPRFLEHLKQLGLDAASAQLSEIYLAYACGQTDHKACAYFELGYLHCLRKGAARVRDDAAFVQEVVQDLRHKLFIGPPPKILSYTGRGPLSTWLRVVAGRAAVDHARAERRRWKPASELLETIATPESSLEVKLDRARYVEAFQRALDSAMSALEPKELDMLRLHYAKGVNIDGIGEAYQVHRATAARWIARIRKQLLAAVRQELGQNFETLTQTEFENLTILVASRLDVAVSGWVNSVKSRGPTPPAQ
jgi:RNA polymerase sigma-70 factor, ECF subfamily